MIPHNLLSIIFPFIELLFSLIWYLIFYIIFFTFDLYNIINTSFFRSYYCYIAQSEEPLILFCSLDENIIVFEMIE